MKATTDLISTREMADYMEACIDLGKTASIRTVRKPHVGAIVLSKDGKFVGGGYRSLMRGTSCLVHAERMALDIAGDKSEGGTLVTTLEPCVKIRKRGVFFKSCSDLIIERGIRIVIFGFRDYHLERYKHGGGVGYLASEGINVIHFTGRNSKIHQELVRD